MENPLAIANYFVQKSIDTGQELTPLKLVKLVYISHGWYLAFTGVPLISEAVQAWKYGPVVQSVYTAFSKYGKDQISQPYNAFGLNKEPITVKDPDLFRFLDKIWEVYKNHNGLQLSTLTHQPGTPWDIAWNKLNGKNRASAEISNELIKDHYKQKIDANREAAAKNGSV